MADRGVTATIYSKIKKTVKHTLIFGIGSVVNSAFGLVLVPVYARRLTAKDFGILTLLMITLTLVTIVLKFGLNQAFFRHYYDTEDARHRRRLVGTTLLFLFLSASVFTALLYGIAPQISAAVFKGDASRAELLRLVFFIGFFDIITLIPDTILRVNFRSAKYSILNILTFGFQVILISYLVVAVAATVENVLIGRLAGSIFGAAIFFFAVRRELSMSFSMKELQSMLAFGVPLIFGQVSFTLFMMIDRFFLERYAARESEVGYYAMANTLVSAVTILVTVPFGQVWTVMRFSVMNEEAAEEYYSRVLTYIVLASMFLALAVAAVAGDGLLLFGLRGYWPAVTLIPLLALSTVFDSASRVLNIGITLRKRTIFAPVVTTAALAFNIALNFLLIPRYGALGATIATLLSYVAFCLLRYWVSNLFFKVRYEWGRVLTLVATGVSVTGIFYLIDFLRGPSPGDGRLYLSASIKTLLALLFPLALFALGFYDERERRKMGEYRNKLALMLKRRSWKEA
ncbi:MAG: oligosaccharide flippase family protein [Blastocatellia bacterium]|nr:oligosaccharide flippase family protein [Blastocatellia bacterium]